MFLNCIFGRWKSHGPCWLEPIALMFPVFVSLGRPCLQHHLRGSRRSSVKATLTDMAQRNLESAAKAGTRTEAPRKKRDVCQEKWDRTLTWPAEFWGFWVNRPDGNSNYIFWPIGWVFLLISWKMPCCSAVSKIGHGGVSGNGPAREPGLGKTWEDIFWAWSPTANQ